MLFEHLLIFLGVLRHLIQHLFGLLRRKLGLRSRRRSGLTHVTAQREVRMRELVCMEQTLLRVHRGVFEIEMVVRRTSMTILIISSGVKVRLLHTKNVTELIFHNVV